MANKYIIIPDYKPLYAMRYCFGPTHGPLEKPCPTPIDVIGKLLLQSGNEKLNIFEVKVDSKTHKTIGDPVKLTLSNYRQPYEKILTGKIPETDIGEKITKDVKNDPVVITPTQKKDEEDSVVITPRKEEPLVETTIKEKLTSIPEVEPDEVDEKMIKEAEEINDNVVISLEDLPVETTDTNTVVVTTATSSDGIYSSSTVEYEVPTDVPFTSGYIAPIEDDNVTSSNDYVTITSNSFETYKVPVTTTNGTKYIDTGLTEAEYKSLSKSKSRELRKKLALEEVNEITDKEADEIEQNTPILSTFEPSEERKEDYIL